MMQFQLESNEAYKKASKQTNKK